MQRREIQSEVATRGDFQQGPYAQDANEAAHVAEQGRARPRRQASEEQQDHTDSGVGDGRPQHHRWAVVDAQQQCLGAGQPAEHDARRQAQPQSGGKPPGGLGETGRREWRAHEDELPYLNV